jgi:hypothetical protein
LRDAWKRIKYMQLFYVAGIVLIVVYSIWSAVQLHTNAPVPASNSQPAAPPVKTDNPDTLTQLVIKPIVTSEYNRIIFTGLFYIFVWILLFLVVPVAFFRLKKFKFFNVEFEVETERAALQNAIVTTSKASLMEYLTGNDVFIKTLGCMHGNMIAFADVLQVLLEDIQTAYRDTFNAGFTFEVYEDQIPKKYRSMAQNSSEIRKASIWNKPGSDNPFKCNMLVYHYPLSEGSILTVLSSYSTQFDAFDQHMLPLLHNVIRKNIESIELMVVATSPMEQDVS